MSLTGGTSNDIKLSMIDKFSFIYVKVASDPKPLGKTKKPMKAHWELFLPSIEIGSCKTKNKNVTK